MLADRKPETITEIWQRWKGHARLWLNAQYRRDAIGLLVTGLRSLAGLRFGVILLLLIASGFWLVQMNINSPRRAYEIISWIFGLTALIAAAPIYSSEQQRGTLELVWLARGSSKALLRYKAFVLMTAVAFLALPSVLLTTWFLYGGLPFAVTLLFLITNAYLIIAVVAATGTYIPQAWASTLVSAAIIVAAFVLGREKISFFNFFLNPVSMGPELLAGGGAFASSVSSTKALIINRVFVIIVASILLSTAAKRLRKVLA